MTPIQKLRDLCSPEPSSPAPWHPSERRFFNRCLGVSALIFLVYAVACLKFINAESYFQTVEFTSYKLGLTANDNLMWEYAARMRSWLQPGIYYVIARAADLVAVERPLTLLLLFRQFTALVCWASMWMLIAAGRRWIASEADRRLLYLSAALLWLLPYLGVRTSGEAMSAAMLCVGIAMLEWRTDRDQARTRFGFAVLAGVAFGLCFELRYPTGVMAAGAALAYLRFPKERWSLIVGLTLGGLAAMGLATAVNLWGYGAIAFPFLAYVQENFVLGKSNTYGTAPFFAYLYLPLENPMAPVALFLLATTLIAWFRRPKNVLVWSALPYVLMLSVTGHKETRFLFTLAPFLPFFIAFALSGRERLETSAGSGLSRWRAFASLHGTRFLVIWNLVGLAAIPVVEFWFGDFSIYRTAENAVYSTPRPQTIALVRNSNQEFAYSDPGRPRFIYPRSVNWNVNPDLAAVKELQTSGQPFLALIDLPRRNVQPHEWISQQCVLLHSSLPQWWLRFLESRDVKKMPRWRELYRC